MHPQVGHAEHRGVKCGSLPLREQKPAEESPRLDQSTLIVSTLANPHYALTVQRS
jgi:hypothetical protein